MANKAPENARIHFLQTNFGSNRTSRPASEMVRSCPICPLRPLLSDPAISPASCHSFQRDTQPPAIYLQAMNTAGHPAKTGIIIAQHAEIHPFLPSDDSVRRSRTPLRAPGWILLPTGDDRRNEPHGQDCPDYQQTRERVFRDDPTSGLFQDRWFLDVDFFDCLVETYHFDHHLRILQSAKICSAPVPGRRREDRPPSPGSAGRR